MSGLINTTGAVSGILGTTVGNADLSTSTFPAGHVVGYSFHTSEGISTGNWVTLADGSYKILCIWWNNPGSHLFFEHWSTVVTSGTASTTENYNWAGHVVVETSGNQVRLKNTSGDYHVPAMFVIQA